MRIEKYTYIEDGIKLEVPISEGNAYLNATEAYKAFGKSQQAFSKFIKDKLTPYAERLVELGKVSTQLKVVSTDTEELGAITIIRGGDSQEQGTWLHPKLSIQFARWLSMDFEIWCDEKIDELLNKGYTGTTDAITEVLDDIAPQIKEIKSYVRKTGGGMRMNKLVEVLSAMENASHTLNDYRTVLSGITTSATTLEREKVYNKLIKGAYKTFETGKISRRTLEDVLQILNANLIKLLRRRQTELITKLSSSKKVDITPYIGEIADLKTKLEELEEQLDDPRPVKFELRTIKVATDSTAAVKTLTKNNEYIIIFNGILKHNVNKPEKKYPDWAGDSVASSGRLNSTGLWENEGCYYFKAGMSTPPYAQFCAGEMYQSPSNEEVFVGADNVKRHFITFNQVTGNCIIYRKK